jgi:hypothetical protein
MIEPQKRYFKAMNEYAPGYVQFIKADTEENNVQSIIENCSHTKETKKSPQFSLELFQSLTLWLSNNRAK